MNAPLVDSDAAVGAVVDLVVVDVGVVARPDGDAPSAELLGVQEAVGLGLPLRESGVRPDDLEARYLHPRHPCRVCVHVWVVITVKLHNDLPRRLHARICAC